MEARAGVKDSEKVLSTITALSLSGSEEPPYSARFEGRALRSRNRTLPQYGEQELGGKKNQVSSQIIIMGLREVVVGVVIGVVMGMVMGGVLELVVVGKGLEISMNR